MNLVGHLLNLILLSEFRSTFWFTVTIAKVAIAPPVASYSVRCHKLAEVGAFVEMIITKQLSIHHSSPNVATCSLCCYRVLTLFCLVAVNVAKGAVGLGPSTTSFACFGKADTWDVPKPSKIVHILLAHVFLVHVHIHLVELCVHCKRVRVRARTGERRRRALRR
ncbi:MAG: hypothetical protein J3Q66DRAFT_321750 [Benniella sp.]|nr:MAG: hypothetical protein J3Q66DRAFT_321750 [Benniella sp.]